MDEINRLSVEYRAFVEYASMRLMYASDAARRGEPKRAAGLIEECRVALAEVDPRLKQLLGLLKDADRE